MHKITCEIISDLLPLYCDEVCSPDSRRLVEEHLCSCKECRVLAGQMRSESMFECEVREIREEPDGEHMIKSMAAAWKKSLIRSFFKGIFTAACACLLLYAAYWGLTRWPVTVIRPAHVEAEASVEDSSYTVRIMTTDGYKSTSSDMVIQEDGKLFIMLKRGIIPIKNGSSAVFGGIFSGSMDAQLESGETVRIKEIYYGIQGCSALLWQEP